jgi:ATP-dependent Clp protease ATP-binding subunit ClpA
MEEARNLNHNYVGTEHILLGLLRVQEGLAAQVLMNLGLKLEKVRSEILSLLGHPQQPGTIVTEKPVPEKTNQPSRSGIRCGYDECGDNAAFHITHVEYSGPKKLDHDFESNPW